jgi:hypothetical protein
MAVIGAFVLAASVVLGVTLWPRGPVSAAVVTETGPLFYTNGNINQTLVQQLSALCAAAKPAGTKTTSGETYRFATARNIASANGTTDAPDMRLFEAVSIPSNPEASGLSQAKWRLVAITYPYSADLFPILTFYSNSPCIQTKFSGTRSIGNPKNYNEAASSDDANNYRGTAGSYLRNTITNIFENNLLTRFPSTVKDLLVRPGAIPGKWQSSPNQPDITNGRSQTLYGERLNDLIWIPSVTEVVSTSFFNLNVTESIAYNGATKANVWTRSSVAGGDNDRCSYIYIDGSIQPLGGGAESLGVRPAIHITLPSPSANIAAGFEPNSVTEAGAGIMVN